MKLAESFNSLCVSLIFGLGLLSLPAAGLHNDSVDPFPFPNRREAEESAERFPQRQQRGQYPQIRDVYATIRQMHLYDMPGSRENFNCTDFAHAFYRGYQDQMRNQGFDPESVWQVHLGGTDYSGHMINLVRFDPGFDGPPRFALIEPQRSPTRRSTGAPLPGDQIITTFVGNADGGTPAIPRQAQEALQAWYQSTEPAMAIHEVTDLRLTVYNGTHAAQLNCGLGIDGYNRRRGPYYNRPGTVLELNQKTGVRVPMNFPQDPRLK